MRDVFVKDDPSIMDDKDLISRIKRLRTIEALTDIIWSVDLNLNITYASPSFEKILGYTLDEIIGKSLDYFIFPESLSQIKHTVNEALLSDSEGTIFQTPPAFAIKAKHRDGSCIWLELSRGFIRDENNSPIGILGVARDISKQVSALQALRESEEKYRALTEQSVLGIMIASRDPVQIIFVNDALERMLGYEREEMMNWVGDEVSKIVYPEDRLAFFQRFQHRLEGLPVPDFHEFRAVRKNGEVIWFEAHGSRIEYQSKQAVHAFFIDITERHTAQKEAEDAKDFTEFLLDLMGHDLNNIHQGIMTGLELISHYKQFSNESEILLESAISQLERAGALISRVTKLSDIKSKTLTIILMDIQGPISKAIESVKRTFPRKDIKINSNINPGMHMVFGCEFLTDVFYNLLHNAVKYDVKDLVVLDIVAENSQDHNSLLISLIDRGPGIPDSKKSSILDRIGQEKTARSGIGLTLAKQIIDRCKGQIWIEDRIPGDSSQGSKFVIVLPCR